MFIVGGCSSRSVKVALSEDVFLKYTSYSGGCIPSHQSFDTNVEISSDGTVKLYCDNFSEPYSKEYPIKTVQLTKTEIEKLKEVVLVNDIMSLPKDISTDSCDGSYSYLTVYTKNNTYHSGGLNVSNEKFQEVEDNVFELIKDEYLELHSEVYAIQEEGYELNSQGTPDTVPAILEIGNDIIDEESIDLLYHDLFIGEIFQTGYVYIEPFSLNRTGVNEEHGYDACSEQISFYTIDGSSSVFESKFVSESNIYIPSIEEGSHYFWQGAYEEIEQYTLRYKSDDVMNKSFIGLTFMANEISSIDYSVMDEAREYTQEEYDTADDEVQTSINIWNEYKGSLRQRTIEDSIIGAKKICVIELKDINYKILLSKYFYIGIESTADVYVIDILDDDGNVIKTFEKNNVVAY